MSKGRAGAPERISLQVDGAFRAGCECPSFSAWFTNPRESFLPILTVPKPGVPDIDLLRPNLTAILVGYFSGATIDTYEYFPAVGKDVPVPGEEERSTRLVLHPEFCVEIWCYGIPAIETKDDYGKFLRGVALEHAARLAKLGVRECRPGWTQPHD